ncbi:amidase [Endozoicomonas sp. SESOKO1]|uniref:amidase family protein n=1 Tax=Endozoicomonas sp. SESOKO1 TaxID=2828742 RepID=UPI002148BCC2|nr:amidase [Endozoicomonas sp. SESOKO1]
MDASITSSSSKSPAFDCEFCLQPKLQGSAFFCHREIKQYPQCRAENLVPSGQMNKGFLLKYIIEPLSRNVTIARIMRSISGLPDSMPAPLTFSQHLINQASSDNAVAARAVGDKEGDKEIITNREYLQFLSEISPDRECDSHLDKSLSDWRGVNAANMANAIQKACQSDQLSEKGKGCITEQGIFEQSLKNRDFQYSKVPVSVKAEYHLNGITATHGIKGEGARQTKTTGFIDKLGASDEFCLLQINTQHALGAGASGINPKDGPLANTYLGKNGQPKIPGGSTSGGSVAVSSGLLPLAIGSDGGGSTRIPAAATGIVGVKSGKAETREKPFFDQTGGAYGDNPDSLVQPGFEAINVDVVAQACLASSTVRPEKRCLDYQKLGVAIDLDALGIANPAVAEKCQQAIGCWQSRYGQTRHVQEVHLMDLENSPDNAKSLALSHVVLFGSEELQTFDSTALSDDQRQQADPELKLNMNLAKTFTDRMKRIATENRDQFKQHLKSLKDRGVDVILMPTTPEVSRDIISGEEKYGMADLRSSLQMSQLTSLANLLDVPAITLPVGHDKIQGMPVGLTLMSTSADDCNLYHLLPLAKEFQNVTRNNEALRMKKPDIYFGDYLQKEE